MGELPRAFERVSRQSPDLHMNALNERAARFDLPPPSAVVAHRHDAASVDLIGADQILWFVVHGNKGRLGWRSFPF
jgi:hypothetical protein